MSARGRSDKQLCLTTIFMEAAYWDVEPTAEEEAAEVAILFARTIDAPALDIAEPLRP